MARRASKKDDNHNPIADNIRSCGLSVEDCHRHGDGFPDFAVGSGKWCVLVEVKNGKKVLTPDEKKFSDRWKGPYFVVNSFQDFVEQWCGLTEEQLIVF